MFQEGNCMTYQEIPDMSGDGKPTDRLSGSLSKKLYYYKKWEVRTTIRTSRWLIFF